MYTRQIKRGLSCLALLILLALFGAVAIGVVIAAHKGHTIDVLGGIAFLAAAALVAAGGGR